MHVTFGMDLDGRAYPVTTPKNVGRVDDVLVGPGRLVDLLRTSFGTLGPTAAPLRRITVWQSKLECASLLAPRFWDSSLAVDPWGTARLLLSWRDALVGAGWKATGCGQARLDDLADAEVYGPPVCPGLPDASREVVQLIVRGEPSGIERLDLVEPRSSLPVDVRAVVDALEVTGTRVAERPAPVGQGSGDLAAVQRFLLDGTLASLHGDGTFTVLDAVSEGSARETTCAWLAAGSGPGTVLLVEGGDSSFLDLGLVRHGLPAAGLSARSPYRAAIQVIALSFALAWKPLDPERLVELLRLPHPPVRRFAAGMLVSALRAQPGLDGSAWDRAWESIRSRLVDEREKDPARRSVDDVIREWRRWTDAIRYDPSVGMPADAAVEICDRVAGWASSLVVHGDALLSDVVGIAKLLREAFSRLGRTPLVRAQVDGMIDHAVAEGLSNPGHVAQAGRLRAVVSPGAVWDTVPTLVWWDFVGLPSGSPPIPWSKAETDALVAVGCHPDDASISVRREDACRRNAVMHARDRVVLVAPRSVAGRALTSHPLAHRLAPLLDHDGNGRRVTVSADLLTTAGSVDLAGRTVTAPSVPASALPVAVRDWTPAPGILDRLRESESASSLEDFVACRFRWILGRVFGIGTGSARMPLSVEQTAGNLAHAVSERVFGPGPVPPAERVREEAAQALEDLLPKMAAPLMLPGKASELAYIRARIPAALARLAEMLSEAGSEVLETEATRTARLGNDHVVSARMDIVLKDARGGLSTVDLKWARSRKGRRDELRSGTAVQLATATHLLGTDGGAARAGYYLLRQDTLLGELPDTPEPVPVRDLAETWKAVETSWVGHLRLMSEGTLTSSVPSEGLESTLVEGFDAKGVCDRCDYRKACCVSLVRGGMS